MVIYNFSREWYEDMFEKDHLIFFPGFNVEKLIIRQELYFLSNFCANFGRLPKLVKLGSKNTIGNHEESFGCLAIFPYGLIRLI